MTPGFRLVLLVLLVIPALVLCAGCATGVLMTDEERIVCRDEGCTAWTEREVLNLIRRAQGEGYRKGWTDANNQAGRGM